MAIAVVKTVRRPDRPAYPVMPNKTTRQPNANTNLVLSFPVPMSLGMAWPLPVVKPVLRNLLTPSEYVLNGETADVYFAHTLSILRSENIDPVTVMEVFPVRTGILCGMEEVKSLLKTVLSGTECEVWILEEGDTMDAIEVVLRIKAPYQSYGLYETAIDGILAHTSGWATAARKCVDAAAGLPVLSFGVRHVHPQVAGVMDYASIALIRESHLCL